MIAAPHKSESPAGTGLIANQNTETQAPIISDPRAAEKQFSTLQAKFAMGGHELHRTVSLDGTVTYWAQRWGLVRYLSTLRDAEAFLVLIEGCP